MIDGTEVKNKDNNVPLKILMAIYFYNFFVSTWNIIVIKLKLNMLI